MALHNDIVEFLRSFPNIHDRAERRALIYSATLDKDVEDQIEFEGTTDRFCQLLVHTLARYGTLKDGQHALVALLEVVKDRVGRGGKEKSEKLIQALKTLEDDTPDASVYSPPEKILLSKLPTTGSELFGREQKLELLNNAWNDPHTHIVSIIAWGGVGKTALVNEWLNQIERDNYRGTERVYGWSFYIQGTCADRQVSADEFISHALTWFGDPDPTQGSHWDKGVRLAGLIRQYRTLLILDGVEPLQYPPGDMQGKLRDQGLQVLLKELARAQPGLCVLTTRVAVKDLEHAAKSSIKRLFLEHLSPEAGAKLLETLGVKGTSAELRETVQKFKGHALALNLLGRYLAVAHEGNICKHGLIHLTEEEEQGGHARRVMESYERWLSGTPELNILYMIPSGRR